MAVYLGDSGYVELRRYADDPDLFADLNPADVNPGRRRFSVDFPHNALIIGDQVDIATVDGSPLELVAGHNDPDGNPWPDWRGYIHVDDNDGVRLYDSFEAAINGGFDRALDLVTPTEVRRVAIAVRDGRYKCLANVQSYEITTTRETIDTTVLGDDYRQQYENGLITGQGTLNCFWEHKFALCDDSITSVEVEFPAYLARLVLRLQQGSDFLGRFVLFEGEDVSNEAWIWYEAECVITNVVISVEPTQVITSRVQFVCTGPVELHSGIPPAYLLQRDAAGASGKLLQEGDDGGILLEDPF